MRQREENAMMKRVEMYLNPERKISRREVITFLASGEVVIAKLKDGKNEDVYRIDTMEEVTKLIKLQESGLYSSVQFYK